MSSLGTKGKGGREVDEEEEKRSNMMAKLDMVSVLEAKDIYDAVLQAFPTTLGKSVSKKEREELNLKTPNLVYGEITFETFGTIIEKIRKVYGLPGVGASGNTGVLQSRGGIFYDLGSGTGKPVVAAAILHNFDVCYGIEYLEGLYSVSLDALNSYNTKGKAKLASREHDTHVQMIHGDFLKLRTKDWRDADVVFMNSTCFDETLMGKVAHLAAGMKKGSFFITMTKRLPSAEFEILEYEMHRMSWGEATVFVSQKTTECNEEIEEVSDDEEKLPIEDGPDDEPEVEEDGEGDD